MLAQRVGIARLVGQGGCGCCCGLLLRCWLLSLLPLLPSLAVMMPMTSITTRVVRANYATQQLSLLSMMECKCLQHSVQW